MRAVLTLALLTLAQDPIAEQPVRVTVDTAALNGEDAERLQAFLQTGIVEEVRAQGFTVVEDVSATTLRVRIEYLDEGDLEYAIHYDIVRGTLIDTGVPWVACIFCIDAKLLGAIEDGLLPALERLGQSPAPAPVDKRAPTFSHPPIVVEPPKPKRIKPIGPAGIAGMVVEVSGLALTFAGVWELREDEDHRRTGTVLVATGASVFVVGFVILVADVGVRAKQRARANPAKQVIAPVLGPGIAGLGYVRRF